MSMKIEENTTSPRLTAGSEPVRSSHTRKVFGERCLVMACDDGYAMPLATAILSLVKNAVTNTPTDLIILTSSFSEPMRGKVEEAASESKLKIHWLPVDLDVFDKCTTRTYISKITFARLLLPETFDESVARVVYLDADILVVGDLSPLWEIDLGKSAIAAVIDSDSVPHSQRLNLASEYFNAGMLVIDLKRWREDRISEKALAFMTENPETELADQDALNVACGGKWTKISDRWNYQTDRPTGYYGMPKEDRPSVIHFAGKWKPWSASSLSADAPLYDSYRRATGFARGFDEKVRDFSIETWVLLRLFLKRSKLVGAIYYFLKRQNRTS
jgi:lipopolysaccharide biosynthesis glycosyltransferase